MQEPEFIKRIRKNDEHISRLCNDDRYKILPCGRIETLIQRTGKLSASSKFRCLSQEYKKDGYIRIKYSYKDLLLHRIVYQKYIGQLNPSLQINHKDGNKKNNHFSNLEQVTQSENQLHSFRVLKRKAKPYLEKKNV